MAAINVAAVGVVAPVQAGGRPPGQISISPSVSAIATACVLFVALSLREALRM